MVRCQPSRSRGFPRSPSSATSPLHRRIGLRVGCFVGRRPSVLLVVSQCLAIFDQPPRTPCGSVLDPWIPPSPPGSSGLSVHRQHDCAGVSAQGGRPAVFHPQFRSSGCPSSLRGERRSSASPIRSGEAERSCRLPQSGLPDPGLRMDPLSGGVSGAVSPLAGHYRPVRHVPQQPALSLFLADGRSAVCWDRRCAPIVGLPTSVLVPSVRFPSAGPHQGSPISEPGVDVGGSLLAAEAVVPGSLRAPSGSAGPSAYADGSSQTTPLPSSPPEPPHASLDWLSYCERSARHLGFSSRVAHQLAFCRRSSMHVNYQAKWVIYCSWCHSHGHSISCPSISKIADFLLYLRRSLHLPYSSIASYHFMLSAVCRFVLPEVSSHPILHDLLHFFRIERPLPSSWVPPWDLLLVLNLLWVPPLSRLLLVLSVIFPVRFFSSFLWLRLAVSVRFRLFLLLSPSRVAIFFYLTFLNSMPNLSPLRILCLGLFVYFPCAILWVTYLMNYCFVLCARSRFPYSYFLPVSSASLSLCLSSVSFSSSFQECLKFLLA